jgi:hypothetical protein
MTSNTREWLASLAPDQLDELEQAIPSERWRRAQTVVKDEDVAGDAELKRVRGLWEAKAQADMQEVADWLRAFLETRRQQLMEGKFDHRHICDECLASYVRRRPRALCHKGLWEVQQAIACYSAMRGLCIDSPDA